MIYSAVGAAVAALFAPVPAFADPGIPAAVPDTGARPVALGTLTVPGRPAAPGDTATTTPPAVSTSSNPVVQRAEKGRAEIATLGDQLIQLGQDRDLTAEQQRTAQTKHAKAEADLQAAQTSADAAAKDSVRDAAAMPPGTADGGLFGLGDLNPVQRSQGDSQQGADRQLRNAKEAVRLAQDEENQAGQRLAQLSTQYTTLDAQIVKKQKAQTKYEDEHRGELSAAEATETAADSKLGAEYLAGEDAGRGADPRAIKALEIALSHRGDPYVWSEEGPHEFDCSGLMWAAYRDPAVNFPITRVSRDQYWQTRNKVVDRYSLLPGDLLFFSYTNSWRGIHHVAMYAGNGMMVEAPRTGLNVRLTPVRWSRLFQATRVFGSVDGVVHGPDLGAPDPDPETDTPASPSATPKPTRTISKPPTSTKPIPPKPPTDTKPGTKPTSSATPSASASSSASATPTRSTPVPTPSATSKTPATGDSSGASAAPSTLASSAASSASASASTGKTSSAPAGAATSAADSPSPSSSASAPE